jgi:hypothetical protein
MYNTSSYTHIKLWAYIYTNSLEAAAPTVLMVWLRAFQTGGSRAVKVRKESATLAGNNTAMALVFRM